MRVETAMKTNLVALHVSPGGRFTISLPFEDDCKRHEH
jgi:hypothetical protein